MNMYKDYYYNKALESVQFLEELGGPDTTEYVEVMEALVRELENRISTAQNNPKQRS